MVRFKTNTFFIQSNSIHLSIEESFICLILFFSGGFSFLETPSQLNSLILSHLYRRGGYPDLDHNLSPYHQEVYEHG
jgi:hypothetical protein